MVKILLTVIFMYAGGQATLTLEFDNVVDCQKELQSFVGFLKAQDITPIKAECK